MEAEVMEYSLLDVQKMIYLLLEILYWKAI